MAIRLSVIESGLFNFFFFWGGGGVLKNKAKKELFFLDFFVCFF